MMRSGEGVEKAAVQPPGSKPVIAHIRARQLAFVYLVVPGLIAFVITSVEPQRTREWPFVLALVFWFIACEIGWLTKDLCSRIAAYCLRPWQVPLLVVLIVGGLASIPIIYLLVPQMIAVFQVKLVDPELHLPPPGFTLASMVVDSLTPLLYWVVMNLAFVRVFSISRFGFDPMTDFERAAFAAMRAEADNEKASQPPFFKLLDRDIGELVAMKAEQHYVRVIGDADEALIRYRMVDAVKEAEDWLEGLRVHRSWWVANDHVASSTDRGRERSLLLRSGHEVPVSRAYRAVVDNAMKR